ncbi:hypothetical protein DP145_01725 [Clostridium tetani]|uniref:DUF2184 domain-containing protein n=1 Tax=Clostridium tetani TaxID=1513 RepID=UPI00100B5A59|nr:DUF2184 domain-containing protein [Clostridium tetani]RXI46083.1 hypothetical protein DP126_07805 [Clostridium tetani]RXM61475.1 hypothetical protein DP138_04640 [Clostridium tetani]RXM70300.1 hypothetical protein DP145_01725 [Clostridium tetani]
MYLVDNNRTFTIPGQVPNAMIAMDSAGVSQGMAFLEGELEKKDPKLNEPLTSVTWMRDIVAKTGGGWVENTSNLFVDYATTGGNSNGLIRGQSNNIPVIQANTSKDLFKVFLWSNVLKVPFIDQQKMQSIGRSLDSILDNGIRLNYNKSIDLIVYKGIEEQNIYGLVNNPYILTSTVKKGDKGKTEWETKTPDEILDDINTIINEAWANSEYDNSGIPNHILIPPQQYTYLVSRKVSEAGNISILKYLLENNIAKNQGVDLAIEPSRWCIGSGLNENDRMVCYVNDESKVLIDIPVPLMRAMTQPSVADLAYLTAYMANIGQVKFLYTQCAGYGDGI